MIAYRTPWSAAKGHPPRSQDPLRPDTPGASTIEGQTHHGSEGADPLPASQTQGDADGPSTALDRVLLIEDHAPTRKVLKMLLDWRGCQVTAVGTATEALRSAREGAFDLVISDIGLPDGDGWSLMSVFSSQHGLRGIAVSAYGSPEDVRRSLDSGFSRHLIKPVGMDDLDGALNSMGLPPGA